MWTYTLRILCIFYALPLRIKKVVPWNCGSLVFFLLSRMHECRTIRQPKKIRDRHTKREDLLATEQA